MCIGDLEALCEGIPQLEQHLGLPSAKGGVLPPEFVKGYIDSARLRPDWLGVWAIQNGVIVGSGGFKSKPEDGTVEIGYGVSPEHEGKGIGTEIARRLTELAFIQGAEVVRAHTLREGLASQRILTKNGFSYVGDFIEPEDGLVMRWEIRK